MVAGVVPVDGEHGGHPQLQPRRVLLPRPPLGPQADGRGGGCEAGHEGEAHARPGHEVAPAHAHRGGLLQPPGPRQRGPRLVNLGPSGELDRCCEAQARVRQGSARDGSQGKRPQSLNPSLELTLKLVATFHHHHHHHPPEVSIHWPNGLMMAR